MHVLGIDHVNITGSPELIRACRDFYVDVLQLREGDRPPFRSRGFWLYAGDDPIVHLTETSGEVDGGASALNHFALRCVALAGMLERLRVHHVAYTVNEVPATGRVQVFTKDPAGIAIELSFPADGLRENDHH